MSIPILFGLIILLLLFLLYIQIAKLKKFIRAWSILASVSVSLSFLLLGICLSKLEYGFTSDSYIDFQKKKGIFLGRVCQEPKRTQKGRIFSVDLIRNVEQGKAVSGKVDFFLADTTEPLQKSALLIFKGELLKLNSPDFPFEFDFAKYKSAQGIQYRVYVSSGNLLKVQLPAREPINRMNRFRSSLHSKYTEAIKNAEVRSFVEALVYANKEELPTHTKQSFSNVGVIHILAVSGLHVGIIYLILSRIFGLNRKKQKYSWLRLLAVVIGISLYAGLAGMGPSVLRSGIMFSVLSVGSVLKRRNHSLNSLCLAALIILLIKPSEIWAMGFQFSFLAVGGIVILNDPIRSMLPVNVYFNSLFDLMSVSLAAQLATAPLGIYYFHQFPNYFLLANVLILPFVSIVLVLGILIPLLGSIHPWLLKVLGEIESVYVRFIIDTVEWIETFPHALSSGLVLSKTNLFLCYVLLICLTLWIKYGRKKLGIYALTLWVLILFHHGVADKARGNCSNEEMSYRIIDESHFEVRAPLKLLQDEQWRQYTLNAATIYYGRKAVLCPLDINLDRHPKIY
ncbi:ComEC family competence protein [bacterium]|nr:ComEC family competence protein [bacterium]